MNFQLKAISLVSIFLLVINSANVSYSGPNLSFGDPKRVPFKGFSETMAQPDNSSSFSPFLNNPVASPIELKTLETGEIFCPVDGLLNTNKPKAKELLKKGKYMQVEVYSHWIKHAKAGDILIDAGLDASFRNKGSIYGLLAPNYIRSSKVAPGKSIGEQIEANQINPVAIIYTHLHGDHTAGTLELNKNIRHITGHNEIFHNVPPLYFSDHLKEVNELEEIDVAKCPDWPVIGQACDIFGDKSLFALATPGHTEGHLSFLVMTKTGPVLLTGDASHTRFGFENDIEPGWSEDAKASVTSFQRLKQLINLIPGIQVIYGHQKPGNKRDRFTN